MTEVTTKRQQRAAATADQLLAAARQVFEEKGYQATTVAAITEAANCAHGTFYLHFKNKEDAFVRVVAEVVEGIYDRVSSVPGDDPRAALESATRQYVELFREHLGLWRCVLEGMHQSKAVEATWLEVRRPFIDRIARVLDRAVAAGSARPVNTRVAAHALGAMTEWLTFAHFELDEPPAGEVSVDEVVETLTDLWYHAVYRCGA